MCVHGGSEASGGGAKWLKVRGGAPRAGLATHSGLGQAGSLSIC